MIESAIGLMGATGAGSLGGLAIRGFLNAQANKIKLAEIEARKDAASRDQLKEYLTSLNQAPVEAEISSSNDSTFKFTLFGKDFGYERKYAKKVDKLISSLWVMSTSASLFVLTSTLALCAFLLIDNPSQVVWTLNPASEPSTFGFLWGLFELSLNRESIYQVTTGGLGYALLHGILGIASLSLTLGITQDRG